MRVRDVAGGPAGPAGSRACPRRPASRAVRTVCARTCPHAPSAHDAADTPSGRGDAPPFQGGLDLPGAVASAAVAPDCAHVAGDRIHMLRPGMPGHPVTGGAGNARHPASRRYRAALARIMSAFVRIPAPRGRSRDVVLGPDLPGWLAALARLHDLPFERLVVVAGTFRVGHRRPPIPCHSSLIGLSNTLYPIQVHAFLGQQAHVLGPPGLAHRLPRRIIVPLEHPAVGPCPVIMVARGHLILPAVGQVLRRSLELATLTNHDQGVVEPRTVCVCRHDHNASDRQSSGNPISVAGISG